MHQEDFFHKSCVLFIPQMTLHLAQLDNVEDI